MSTSKELAKTKNCNIVLPHKGTLCSSQEECGPKPRWSKLTGANGSTKLQLKTLDKIQKKQPPKDYGGEKKAKAQGPGRGVETRRSNNKQQAAVCFPIFSPGIEQAHSESTAKTMNRKTSEKPCLSGRGLRKGSPVS